MEAIHPIPPVFDEKSEILLLGSFPSVRSRAEGFYYAHPRNRFWPLLAALAGEEIPQTTEEKKALLHRRHIALWDVAAQCCIDGSADASLRQVQPNDLHRILDCAPIKVIFTNGGAAHRLYQKLCLPQTGRADIPLPSTSPAHAAMNLARLLECWQPVRDALIPLPADPAASKHGYKE